MLNVFRHFSTRVSYFGETHDLGFLIDFFCFECYSIRFSLLRPGSEFVTGLFYKKKIENLFC